MAKTIFTKPYKKAIAYTENQLKKMLGVSKKDEGVSQPAAAVVKKVKPSSPEVAPVGKVKPVSKDVPKLKGVSKLASNLKKNPVPPAKKPKVSGSSFLSGLFKFTKSKKATSKALTTSFNTKKENSTPPQKRPVATTSKNTTTPKETAKPSVVPVVKSSAQLKDSADNSDFEMEFKKDPLLLVIAFLLALLSILILPPVLGFLAIVLSIVTVKQGYHILGVLVAILSIACLVIGVYLAAAEVAEDRILEVYSSLDDWLETQVKP